MSRRISPVIASLLLLSCLCLQFTNATITDIIRPGQSLNTSEIIVSANGTFVLYFWPTENSTNYYVTIALTNQPYSLAVWVANSVPPIHNSSALLTLNPDGNLVISDGSLSHVLTNTSGGGGNDTYARLLDTGNLIITNRASDVLWQSFDYPTGYLLPGMKLKDAKTGWSFTTWKTDQDPAPGPFSLHVGSKKELILMEGSEPYWTSSLVGDLAGIFVIDGDYITWRSNYSNRLIVIEMDVWGNLVQHTWMEDIKEWNNYNLTNCGVDPVCGVFSICNETAYDEYSRCGCLQGFKRGTTGCERETELQCRNASNNIKAQQDWFLHISQVFLPKYPIRLDVGNVSECKTACLNNCSCTGYAYDQEDRCQLWVGPLLNLKHFSADNLYKTDFYLKLAPPEGFENLKVTRNNQLWKIVLPTASIAVVVILGLFVYYMRRKLKRKGGNLLLLDLDMTLKANNSEHEDNRRSEIQIPLFSFASVAATTDNFSIGNKLGEGGFGPVYKGTLLNGEEVAVKRLSKRSGQGWEELKNEAMLIAKLQHKNLVRLLGCCIERDEKILVHEYMPNKSLDFFIFDIEKRRILDWRTRVGIIEGIAQGLLYLHQYSRLRIIHRDLKPSNILLDIDMNPKISDFGLARIFGGNESQANTKRIVGTHGYMSPEYASDGLFSIKSDVFSFGILLLEIVSGRKSIGFYRTESLHLIRYAWELWTNDRESELVDPLLDDDMSSMHMVFRYVNIAFLCVQESVEDRPTMFDVVAMLNNESSILPYPKELAFLNARSVVKDNPVNSSMLETCFTAGASATVSIMEGR